MKENPRNLSRRGFLTAAAILGGGALLAYGTHQGYFWAIQEGVLPNNLNTAPVPTDLLQKFQEINDSTSTPTPFTPLATESCKQTPTAEVTKPTETKVETLESRLLFGGEIDLFDFNKRIRGFFNIKGTEINIPYFRTLEYREGMDFEKEFSTKLGRAIIWKNYYHYEGKNHVYYFLWPHSGRDKGRPLEFTDFQEYLDYVQDEESPRKGWRRTPQEVEEVLKNTLIGSSLLLDQEKNGTALGKVEAAIRIPPLEVNSFFWRYYKSNPEKFFELVARDYPGFGFDKVLGKDKVLVIMTCGLGLDGETPAPGREGSNQGRYIFVVTAQ